MDIKETTTQIMGQGEKYKLKDTYDFEEHVLIGYFKTMREVKQACKNWEMETDNECCFQLRELNPITNKYRIVENWHY